MGSYLIYTVMPREVVIPDVPLSQLPLNGIILVVEESDSGDAPQPLYYLQKNNKEEKEQVCRTDGTICIL